MSNLWFVFHSGEVDDVSLLAAGWYVGRVNSDGTLLYDADTCDGPMTDYDEACLFVDCRNNGWTL